MSVDPKGKLCGNIQSQSACLCLWTLATGAGRHG
jgi:hypothetical protein